MKINISLKKEIIRLKLLNSQTSGRQIANMLQLSHTTVNRFIKLLSQCDCELSELLQLDDKELLQKLGIDSNKRPKNKAEEPDYQYFHEELKKRDVTLKLLWEEYRIECPNGLSYSQTAHNYRLWLKKNRIAMKQTYKVGEQVLVDFCGKTMKIRDAETGKDSKAEVFVAVLGASGYIFACAVETQQVKDWLKCHKAMFNHFGGVPERVITDNLKAAVICNNKSKLQLNRSYVELAEHYNFAIDPTRPRNPRDKGLAEVGVQIVQRGILAKYRNHTFFSLAELNDVIARELKELNKKTTKKFTTSRLEQFNKFDKPYLNSLPIQEFEIKDWHYDLRVSEFYRVTIDGVSYSVPHQYIHQKVDVAIGETMINIYFQKQNIASHRKAKSNEFDIVDIQHMPSNHQHQLENNPQILKMWFGQWGDNCSLWIDEFLSNKRCYADNMRKIIRLKQWIIDNQFTDRLDVACDLSIKMNCFTITNIKSIIETKSYLRLIESNTTNNLISPHHKNVRGGAYYRNLMKQGA